MSSFPSFWPENAGAETTDTCVNRTENRRFWAIGRENRWRLSKKRAYQTFLAGPKCKIA